MWFRSATPRKLTPDRPRWPARNAQRSGPLAAEALEDRTVPGFLSPLGYSAPLALGAVADFNGDGTPDLLFQVQLSSRTGPPPPPYLSVGLGNGDGTFQPARA